MNCLCPLPTTSAKSNALSFIAVVFVLLGYLGAPTRSGAVENDWTQWGGPNRDFTVNVDPGLATSWPSEGPKVLWRTALGKDGHSGIVVEGDNLFTHYRRDDQDALVALDRASGRVVWEAVYDAPLPTNYNLQFGPGPHATPLIVGDRIFTASSTAVVHAFDKRTGKVAWQRDLISELEVPPMSRGYGASPIAWKDLVIVNGGGEGQGVVAMRQSNGEVVWRSLSGGPGYSSPILAKIDGTTQLVVALGPKRAGLDPSTGKVLWELDLPDSAATTMSTQKQVGPNWIFGSSAYADGSRLIEVKRDGKGWQATQKWYSRDLRVMHQTVAQFGNRIYGSSGDFGPAFLAALDLETGELAFRQRGFAKANLMRVGDNVLLLDEDGVLAIGRPNESGVEVLAKSDVLEGVSWTVPTLIGTTAYLRNRQEILALDLGVSGSGKSIEGDLETEVAAQTSLDSVPPRSAAGLSLMAPAGLLAAGQLYHVVTGDDPQFVMRAEAPLQSSLMTTDSAVGFLVSPFDVEKLPQDQSPLLAVAIRLPLPSLRSSPTLAGDVLGESLAATEKELTLLFKGVKRFEKLSNDDPDRTDFDMLAGFVARANGKEVMLELPLKLSFQRSSNAALNKNIGDLVFVRTELELDLNEFGAAVPPPLANLLSPIWAVSVSLSATTANPDHDVLVPDQEFAAETQFSVLAHDFADDIAAFALGKKIVADRWNNGPALSRFATQILTEPDVERRPLGLALRAAKRASELASDNDALTLNTLARAMFETGDTDGALAAQRKAVALIGEGSRQRAAIEANLARYEAAVQ